MTKASPSSPPADFSKERDELLRSFSRGARLTEQFVSQYAELRKHTIELQSDNARLRAQLEADDAVARLLSKVESLEGERRELLSRTESAERAKSQVHERFNEAEDEFSSLVNLYVVSNQLHSSLTPRAVVRRIKEVLAQLVGAESYAVFLVSSDQSELVPIASEGVSGSKLGNVSMENSRIGSIVRVGSAHIDDERPSNTFDSEDPPVVIPLKVDDAAVGAIAIYATLEQKPRFSHTDFELFQLLGQHAASALVGAQLFDQAGRRLPGAESFRDLCV